MILSPRLNWRKLMWLAVVPVVAVVLALTPLAFAAIAAYPLPPLTSPFAGHPVLAAATETPEPCEVWKTAGLVTIYKCVDDEPPWAVCYVPVAGVMQCVLE